VKCNEHWKVFKQELAADTAHDIHKGCLTLILLTWSIRWAPNNVRKWQMGFNSVFKGLKPLLQTQINNIKVKVIPSLVQML